MVPVTAVLAALVVTVITLVNRTGRQGGSILDNLTASDVARRAWPGPVEPEDSR